jgi:predicted alpha/beta-hydrolase family hydrolase
MTAIAAQEVKIDIEKADAVSALLICPDDARACYVFAHGAGAGMTHSFMETAAQGLSERGVATLRYQFPYMEKGSKRPDSPSVAHAAVRAAVAEAGRRCAGLRLIAGGKSFGGRMTSQAQAISPLPGVHGLAFFGFPLHPAGKPSSDRARHLSDIDVPMLFLQGTRDSLAELSLLEPVVASLGSSRRCIASKARIIPSTCSHVRDAMTAKSWVKSWTRLRRGPGRSERRKRRPDCASLDRGYDGFSA